MTESESVEQMMARLKASFANAGIGSSAGVSSAMNQTQKPDIQRQKSDDNWDFDADTEGDLLADFGDDDDLLGGSLGGPSIGGSLMPMDDMVPKTQFDQLQQRCMHMSMENQQMVQQMQQMQLSFEAERQTYGPIVAQFQELQVTSQRDRIELQVKITQLEEQCKQAMEEVMSLRGVKEGVGQMMQQKDAQTAQMKMAVEQQMNTMRAHFMALQQEYINVKGLNETLTEQVGTFKDRIGTLESQIGTRNQELQEAHSKLTESQTKLQKSQEELVAMKQSHVGLTSEANEKFKEMQQQYGALMQQHQQLYMMNESLKQQFVALKMEYAKVMQQGGAQGGANPQQIQAMQQQIQALQQEKAELMTMTEMLLSGNHSE